MNINKFAEKHNVGRNEIDYWTCIGLLHPDINDRNGYRDYGDRAESEIGLILVASALDNGPIKETVNKLNGMNSTRWRNEVISKLHKKSVNSSSRFSEAIERARDILLEKEP